MVKLELTVNGKKKTYVTEKVTVRTMREVMAYYSKMEQIEKGKLEMSEMEILDDLINLVLTIFKNTKLDYDTLIDNVGFDELLPLIESVMTQVSGGNASKEK